MNRLFSVVLARSLPFCPVLSRPLPFSHVLSGLVPIFCTFFSQKILYLGALRLFLRMCRQLQMIRRLGYVRQVMIGGDPRGAQDFGRVVLPGPTRPHTRRARRFSLAPTFRDWILSTQRMPVRGDWILPTQRTVRGGGRHFIYTKNVWRKIM